MQNKLSLYNGYNYGADRLFKLTEYIFDTYDVNHISAFALSKNNLNRKKSQDVKLKYNFKDYKH